MIDTSVSVVRNLKKFIELNLLFNGSPVQVIEQFPTPNIELQFPSISISLTSSKEESRSILYLDDENYLVDENGEIDYKFTHGDGNYSLQIDLWASSKGERSTLSALLKKCFRIQFEQLQSDSSQIVLNMPDYYNERASYVLTDNDLLDDEFSSLKSEWRGKFVCLSTCRLVDTVKRKVIKKTILHTDGIK